MKKLLLLILSMSILLVGCEKKESLDNKDKENVNSNYKAPERKDVDYSEYDFTKVRWTREVSGDSEVLTLYPNGDFSYYCLCGDPVNDSDLCEYYVYDDESKTITLGCEDTTSNMVTSFKIISSSKDKLVLDFNNEERTFTVYDEE